MIALLATIIILSSSDCGYGLPCGPIPWDLPHLPRVMSPTPIPTVHIMATPTPTSTPLPTATATPPTNVTATPTEQVDELIDGLLGDIDGMVKQTQIPITNDGQEIGFDTINQFETATLWGYLRGILGVNLGVFTPLLTVAVYGIFIKIFTKSSTVTFPLVAFGLGLLRKIVSFILSFIPGLGGK